MRNDIRHALGTLINRDFMTLWFASMQSCKYFVNMFYIEDKRWNPNPTIIFLNESRLHTTSAVYLGYFCHAGANNMNPY